MGGIYVHTHVIKLRTIDNVISGIFTLQQSLCATWRMHNGHCYLFGTKVTSFSRADKDCRKHSSQLATVSSLNETNYIISVIKQ